MNKYILTVTLNPAIDKTILVDPLGPHPDGDGKHEFISAGGKGINVARVLKQLHQRVMATGLYGGVNGRLFYKLLQKEKISFSFVKIQGETRINLTLLDYKYGHQKRVIEEGPFVTPQEIRRFEKRFQRLCKKARGVVFAGREMKQHQKKERIYGRLIQYVQRKGIAVLLDTSGLALQRALRIKPLIVKPNLQEAEDAVGFPLKTLTQVKKAIAVMHRQGIPIILLTMGERGAVCSNGQEILRITHLPAGRVGSLWEQAGPVQKTMWDVGCGDAFAAGFFVSYLRRKSFRESVRLAAAAALASTKGGHIPGKFLLRDFSQAMKKIMIRNLNV